MVYQILYLVLTLMGLFFAAYNHRKEKQKRYNFWSSLIANLIIIIILVKGGFFDVIFNKF